jgi:hypothetical protein
MTATTAQEIPAALPVSESEDEREKLLREAASDAQPASENTSEGIDEEEDSALEAQLAKPSKKKLFLAFVLFVYSFVMLLAVLCWFFGIGVFAQNPKQTVDRTPKANQLGAPATEDEKLKMALNLVADKTPTRSSENSLNSANGDLPVTETQPNRSADLPESVVVPDPLSTSNPNSAVVAPVATNADSMEAQTVSPAAEKNASVSNTDKSNPVVLSAQKTISDSETPARTLFFGVMKKEKSEAIVPGITQTGTRRENFDAANVTVATAPIPFGTLLPIRFLGAVFTLRASGGLVRMELTRAVSGKNYSYPAGTLLIGTLRGSEYKRAFVSVVGLIDPKSGGLVKFEGEVMGGDGASGVVGRRRKIKSAWSRILQGLREVGASAVNVIGSRRSGGAAVIVSDSQTRASDVLSQEIGEASRSGEFVEISAGTNAYVLVTDLPDEISGESRLALNQKSATGLTDEELANLFSEGSPEKIRAAMPRMTPQFRRLAEQVLAAMENQ